MTHCPSKNDLQSLLSNRLPDDSRTSVETHVESCPACQRRLDALTQSESLKLTPGSARADAAPAFLERLQANYPDTLLNGDTGKSATLRFPDPPTERAPLGQIGDFEILAELGSGSFGWVFRAREKSLQRIVALKVLKPEMTARPDALMRFEREARKASLKHDHIVSVHRFEKPAGFPPYLVMEYVEGETLDARLKREGKLTPQNAAAIARQVALGLAAAHAHGMVHRDIKPANILLDKTTGRARISDFGLARDIADESLAVTTAGELAGTAPYMSPEHFRSPDKLDGRSDVFSLGIVLYQMLTGQLPFKGSFLQIRSGILDDEPTSPRRLNDKVPVDLETITLACLQKDPERRYANAEAVAEDLRRYQSNEPILCRPTGQVERTVKWMCRKPAQAALIGVGAIAAAALIVLVVGQVLYGKLQDANQALAQTKDKLETTNGELNDTNGKLQQNKARVEHLNYIADMNLAHQAWQNDDFRLLEQYLRAHEKSELRGFEWHYLRWLASTDGRRIGPNAPISTFAFDTAGRRLALCVGTEKESHIEIWATPSVSKPQGEMLHKFKGQASDITDVAFHPTKDIVISSDRKGTIVLWAMTKKAPAQTLQGNAPFAVSSNGDTLAYVRADGAIERWSFEQGHAVGAPLSFDVVGGGDDKGKPGPRFPESNKPRKSKAEEARKSLSRDSKSQPSGIERLTFSADGKFLAAAGGQYKLVGRVAVWDLKSGKAISLTGADFDDLQTSVAFSPDGKSLAAIGFDHALRVWDLKTGALRFRNVGHKLEILSVAFNATGDLLATAGWDKAVRIWKADTGESVGSLRGNRGVVRQVAFCADTKSFGPDHFVTLNDQGDLRWWDAGQEQAAQVKRLGESVEAVLFSPKGLYLAASGRAKKVVIQELAEPFKTSELTLTLPASRILFSRDETTLFTAEGSTLQSWPFVKVGNAIEIPGLVACTPERFVVRMEGRWLVSQSHPSAVEPLHNVVSFNAAPTEEPVLVTVDAAGDRLAYALKDGSIVIRRRNSQTGAVTEEKLHAAGATKGDRSVNAMAFSPDGQTLAVSVTITPESLAQEYSIWLFTTESGALRHQLNGHLCYIGALAFSPDGKRLVSGSEDWTIKLWDLEVARATITLTGHKGRIRDLAFSPDGTQLASASEDGTVRIWPGVIEPAEERRPVPANTPTPIKRGAK